MFDSNTWNYKFKLHVSHVNHGSTMWNGLEPFGVKHCSSNFEAVDDFRSTDTQMWIKFSMQGALCSS